MIKIKYTLLRLITAIFSIFPLRVHYLFSDSLFFLTYYIVQYRRSVVATNLAHSFPEKSIQERKIIEKKFYHHFCDTIIETLYFDRISVAEAKRRVNYINPELPNHYLDQNREVIIFLGHYNNWEWYCTWPLHSPHRFYAIYKKIRDKAFDRFYKHLRGRFGAQPLERSNTFRTLYLSHQKGTPSISAFLFDQTPRLHEIHHWVTFLNQETPVVLGAEKVAQKLDAVVLFANSKKVKRGMYQVEFQLVTEHAGSSAKYEITDQCTKMLEHQIIENPPYWLWSHRRWKHTKEKAAAYHEENNHEQMHYPQSSTIEKMTTHNTTVK